MRLREAILVILLLPLVGFVGWQVFSQMQASARASAEAVRTPASSPETPLLSDNPTAAGPAAAVPPAGDTPTQSVTSVAAASDAGHDAADLRRRVALGIRGTYLDEILLARDSGLARWPERVVNPLRVWVQDGGALKGWNAHYPDRVREAFETWSLAGAPVKFTDVRDSTDADVIVTWVDHFDAPITGRTLWSRDRNWWIVNGSITLALHHTTGEELDEPAIHAISIHEVGHLLGLDHCADTTNIMTSRVRVHDLSNTDRATIRLLYSLPPGSLKN